MTHAWKPLRRALLPLAALGVLACQGNDSPIGSPISPGKEAPPTVEINGVKLVTLAPGRELDRILTPAGDAVLVHPKEGATIATGDAKLTVLPGSVPNGTHVTMEPQNNGYIEFKFGPNGLQFSPSATLTISAAKANLGAVDKPQLRIAGASDDQNDWTVLGGTYDPATDTVTVSISHFSRYALCVE